MIYFKAWKAKPKSFQQNGILKNGLENFKGLKS